jgi:hypothetical protein
MPVAVSLLIVSILAFAADAQTRQAYSDGAVEVSTKKLVNAEGRVSFEVCGQLTREHPPCSVEVRLTFRGASGEILSQASPVITPRLASPACTRVALPAAAKDMRRWEISRYRCLSDRALGTGVVK